MEIAFISGWDMGKPDEMRMPDCGDLDLAFMDGRVVSAQCCCNSLVPSCENLLQQERNMGNMQHHTDSLFAYCHKQ